MTPRLLSREEAAAYLNIGLTTFRLDVQSPNGTVKPIKIRGRVLFDQRDLDAWVDRQKGSTSVTSEAGPTPASLGSITSTASLSARKTSARLRKPPRVRTPKSSPVNGAPSAGSPGSSST